MMTNNIFDLEIKKHESYLDVICQKKSCIVLIGLRSLTNDENIDFNNLKSEIIGRLIILKQLKSIQEKEIALSNEKYRRACNVN